MLLRKYLSQYYGGVDVNTVNLLHEYEKWANQVCTRILLLLAVCGIPIYLLVPNIPGHWRIILTATSLVAGGFLVFIGNNEQTSKATKYVAALLLNIVPTLMTLTMGKGNRSVPFFSSQSWPFA